MFAGLAEKLRGARAKGMAVLTKTDDLERLCLGLAGAMYADGKAEQAEYDQANNVLNQRFGAVFSPGTIRTALDKAVKVFDGGSKFSARSIVYASFDKVENAAEGEAIFVGILDVLDATGGIGDDERPYLLECAKRLHVDPGKYL